MKICHIMFSLEEMDDDQPLVAYNTTMEIEPESADAYLGIAEVYRRANESEFALEYTREGYGITGDGVWKRK